jgi:hypothetical protein
MKGGWNIYYDAAYEKVKLVAAADIETLSSSFYFSKKLKYLVLSSISSDIVVGVDLLDKFTTLLSILSESLLLTMSGNTQKEEDYE